MADIIVNMNDSTQVTSAEAFGKALIFCTTKDFEYKEYDLYEGLGSVQKDFDTETAVYKIIETFSKADWKPEIIAVAGKKIDVGEGVTLNKSKEEILKKELTNLNNEHPNWYRLILEENTIENIKSASSWVESANKMLYAQINKTTEKVIEEVKENKRVALFYSEIEGQYNNSGACAYAVTRTTGSFIFKFKPLRGCKTDKLIAERLNELTNKHINCYVEKFKSEGIGTGQLNSGYVANGDFIDHIESMDYIKFKVTCEIAKILSKKEKIPYTDEGIQMIVSCVNTALNDAFKEGVIAKTKSNTADIKIEYKGIDTLSEEDRKNRILKGIKFKYVESGAIEKVYVDGEVALNL